MESSSIANSRKNPLEVASTTLTTFLPIVVQFFLPRMQFNIYDFDLQT